MTRDGVQDLLICIRIENCTDDERHEDLRAALDALRAARTQGKP